MKLFSKSELPVWLSVTINDVDVSIGKPQLRSGESLASILAICDKLNPEALLFNCSQPEVMEDAILMASKHFAGYNAPLIGVYANAFLLADEYYGGANESIYEFLYRYGKHLDRRRGFEIPQTRIKKNNKFKTTPIFSGR